MSNMLKRAAFALLLVGGLAVGCVVSAQMGGAKEEPKAKEEVKEDGSKLPWSLDDIKKSMKVGSSMKFKLEVAQGDNKTTTWMTTEITEVTDKGYKSKTTYTDKDGKAMEGMEAEEEEKEWGDMYAEFLSPSTTVTTEKVKVGDKELECKAYSTKVENENMKSNLKICFIKDKPGYVAKLEAVAESGENKQTTLLTLIEMK
ncbi:hypothetical protein PLCT2_01077 [Planctomycetaceae bacterium]|nr:hypothetical protein PLCT2_01077 [Planctomycetaceae bacterium]